MKIHMVRGDGAHLEFEVRTKNPVETEAYLLQATDAYKRMIEIDREAGILMSFGDPTVFVDLSDDDENEAEDAA